MKKLLVVAVVASVGIVAWLWWQQRRPAPLVVSGFIEADQIRVGSRVGGRVAEVMVLEGQRVSARQPLFRIDPYDLKEKLAQAEAELAAARAEHEKLKAGYRTEEVDQAKAHRDRLAAALEKAIAGPRYREIEIADQQVKVAQANLELAASQHKYVMSMAQGQSASQTEIDRANRELKKAQAEMAAAEQQLALLREGTRKEEIAEARAALAEAEAALKLLEQGYRVQDVEQAAAKRAAAEAAVATIRRQLLELTVLAPSDCTVEATDLQPGDLVGPNAPAVSLLDAASLWVRTYVPESKLGRLALGQRVPVHVDSFPGKVFHGRVTFIASEAEFTPRNIQTPEERSKQVFRVKITLEDGLDVLRVGMMGDVLLDEAAPPPAAATAEAKRGPTP